MFSQAVRLSAGDYDIRYRLAMALWKSGDNQAALSQLQAAEKLKPEQVQVHSALARILSELGEEEQAAGRAHFGRAPDVA